MGRKRKSSLNQPTLAGFLKKSRPQEVAFDLNFNVQENERQGENSNIDEGIVSIVGSEHRCEDSDANENQNQEQSHIDALDLEVGSFGASSLKKRSFREQWKLEFPWVRPIGVDGITRLKCMYCERFGVNSPWGIGKGAKSLQRAALKGHNDTQIHKFSRTRWLAEQGRIGKPIEQHVQVISEFVKAKIITTMKLVYWIACNGFPLASYPELCNLARIVGVQGMPAQDDYGTYTNQVSGKEFLLSISDYLEALHI
jgi:hypothetical protein